MSEETDLTSSSSRRVSTDLVIPKLKTSSVSSVSSVYHQNCACVDQTEGQSSCLNTPRGRRRRRNPRKGKLEQRLDYAKECLVEEMLAVLSGSVESNSVVNYFLAEHLIRESRDMRREISKKITEQVISFFSSLVDVDVYNYFLFKHTLDPWDTERPPWCFLKVSFIF